MFRQFGAARSTTMLMGFLWLASPAPVLGQVGTEAELPPGPTSPRQEPPPQKKIPLLVRMGDVSINKVPFLIALDRGLYAKHGLDVTMIPYGTGAATGHGIKDAVPADLRARAGEAQISIGGGAPGLLSRVRRSHPSDQVILATTDHIVHWHILANKGIEKLEDLKGKRIAISSLSACTGNIAMMLADRMGWDPVQDLAILEGDYSVTPLKEGWADALIAYDVPLAMARLEGYRPIADLRSWNEPIPCNSVWASRSWANKNRDTVLRFLKAVVEGIALLKKEPAAAYAAMSKWYQFTDREVQKIIYSGAAEMPRKPYPAVDGIKRIMELYDSNAMRRYKPEDFYDDSFMREIDKSGFIDKLYR